MWHGRETSARQANCRGNLVSLPCTCFLVFSLFFYYLRATFGFNITSSKLFNKVYELGKIYRRILISYWVLILLFCLSFKLFCLLSETKYTTSHLATGKKASLFHLLGKEGKELSRATDNHDEMLFIWTAFNTTAGVLGKAPVLFSYSAYHLRGETLNISWNHDRLGNNRNSTRLRARDETQLTFLVTINVSRRLCLAHS